MDFLNYVLNQVDWNVYEHTNLQHNKTEVSLYPSIEGFYTLRASAVCENDYGSRYSVGMEKAIDIPENMVVLLPLALCSDYPLTIEA